MRASASASLNVESIDADKLSVAAGGESQVALAGEVAQARMEAVGNAQLDAWELSVQHLELRCIGNSKVVVAPSAHLTGKALGSCAVANVGGGDVSLSVEDQATLD